MSAPYDVESRKLRDCLAEYVFEGYVTCRECGLHLDNNDCPECGWKNPITEVV